ncbi:ankyrin [Schizophyllum commune H4-8]|uniref:ankyrin n=1 Tax=Schizophyllum commune (strain H4-8 / FGSC 9210) TaxID=578458 RepID=UPI00216056B4|nr:ankyrin [Schizophyllum commune H4-8]KAI5889907.1 ankyrin [Schizophyllum commune H4-8]
MAECQRRMGVDFLGPETKNLRSEEAVMDYITGRGDTAPDGQCKNRWEGLRASLIPLARVTKIFCDPIADAISDSFPPSKIIFATVGLIITASIQAHEEFEQITDALEAIKVHLQVIEMLDGHHGQLLGDTAFELLVHIIIVLSVIAKMRRERFTGRFLKAVAEIRPLSDALEDLERITSYYKEAIIAGTLDVVTNIKTSDEMERIMAWLKYDSVDSSQRISSLLNDRMKGTGLWLFEHRAFVDFMEAQTRVLVIQGKAGSGKSTILAAANRHLRAYCSSRGCDHIVATHFFDASNSSVRGDLDSVLSSFLCQLALGNQHCMDELAKARQKSIVNGGLTREEKLDILIGMLSNRLRVFFVIDALDEALEKEHARILDALRRLRLSTNISIIVSTRVFLSDDDLQSTTLSIDQVEDNTDIRTTLDIEFSEGGRLAGIANAAMVRDELLLRAEGNMRWTTLVIEQLRGYASAPHKLEKLLHDLPPTLHGLYAERLAAVPSGDVEDVRTLFAWILNPTLEFILTIERLALVLAFDYSQDMPEYRPDWLSSHPGGLIAKLLDSTFVTIVHGVVRIAHASVREFLVALGPSSRFHISSDDALRLKASTSLAYLRAVAEGNAPEDYDGHLVQVWHWLLLSPSANTHYASLERVITDVLGAVHASSPPSGILSPALYTAAIQGNAELVSLLLRSGADSDAPLEASQARFSHYRNAVEQWDIANGGTTSLHIAAYRGFFQVARLLLAHGASVSARDGLRDTPLMVAARRGHESIACLLLDAGAQIEERGAQGWTALHRAAGEGHLGLTSLLLDQDADLDAADELRQTPLHHAAAQGHTKIVRYLAILGAALEARDLLGQTPLYVAAYTAGRRVQIFR